MTIILDAKGCLMHSLLRGGDDEPSVQAGLNTFYRTYIKPHLSKGRTTLDIYAVWDGGNDLRRAWYPNYKAKRKARDEEAKASVKSQRVEEAVSKAKSLMRALGVIQISCDLTEADDLIALLVEKIPGSKEIYTVDKDLLQLVQEGVEVFYRGKRFDSDKLEDGTPLHLIALNKSLLGDSSDEYPGVTGFGPAAWKVLADAVGVDGLEDLEMFVKNRDYDELAEAVKCCDDLKLKKVLTLIHLNTQEWETSYRLACLHPDSCYRVHKRKIVRPVIDHQVAEEFEVRQELKHCGLPDKTYEDLQELCCDMALVDQENLQEMKEFFMAHCNDGPFIGFDFETTDQLNHPDFLEATTGDVYVDILSSKVTGASFNFGDNLQYTLYLSVDHADTLNLDKSEVVEFLRACDPKKLAVQNAAFEVAVSKLDLEYHIESPVDTQILHCHIDEDCLQGHGLKYLSRHYLDYSQDTYKETLERAGVGNMSELSGVQVLKYGCDDALVTSHLATIFRLETLLEGTWDFINNHEFPSVHPLVDGFIAGLNVDQEYLKNLSEEDAKVISDGMSRIRGVLQENCKTISEGNDSWWGAQRDYLEAVLKEKYDDPDEVEKQLAIKYDEFKRASVYHESYLAPKKVVEFIPTPTKLNAICKHLGLGQFQIKSASSSGLTKWRLEIQRAEDMGEFELTDEQDKFLELLLPASHLLKKRSGEEYESLRGYCQSKLEEATPSEMVSKGDQLNLDSPAQNMTLLYSKLGLPVRVFTKVNGKSKRFKWGLKPGPATDDKAFETALAEDCEGENQWRGDVLSSVREVKSAQTRFKFYYNAYPKWVHPADGNVHPQVKNCGTVTRRPSSRDPNILAMTKKDGGKIRTAIRPLKPDHVIISPDWSGQELRILASESEDPVLLDAYLGSTLKDVHSITGASIAPAVLRVTYPEVLDTLQVKPTGMDYEQFVNALTVDSLAKAIGYVRKQAKGVNFLINYLGSAGTLSRNLSIPKERAQEFMDLTFKRYGRLRPWQQETINFAKTRGYTQTAYGNRRHMTQDILSPDGFVASRMERQAVNAVIQGCAADILKVTLSAIHKEGLFQAVGATLLAPVYDEMAISVPAEFCAYLIGELDRIMSVTPPGHAVPMVPEHCVGRSWGEMIELGARPTKEAIQQAVSRCVEIQEEEMTV